MSVINVPEQVGLVIPESGWVQAYYKGGIAPGYTAHSNGLVRGKGGNILEVNQNGRVSLWFDKGYNVAITHIILCSFRRDTKPLQSAFHINGDYSDNRLENLQWLSRSDLSTQLNNFKRSSHGPSLSKAVIEIAGGPDGAPLEGGRYPSAEAAARALNLRQIAVSQSARHGWAAKGHYFKWESQPDLPDETWHTSDALDEYVGQVGKKRKIKISNMGRVLSLYGVKSFGTIGGIGKQKYRNHNVFKMHALVWATFKNEQPPSFNAKNAEGKRIVLCHTDSAPLDDDGCYQNLFEYLRVDTQSNNVLEYHAEKRKKRTAAEADLE